MPFLKSPDMQPVKGIQLSLPDSYLPEGYNSPKNMQYFRGELRKRDGKNQLGSQTIAGNKVMHLGILQTSTGNVRLIRHTTKNVEQYSAYSGLWNDITGVELTGDIMNFFSHTVVTEEDLYLFTNDRIDAIRKYNNSGVTQALGGNPPKCSFMEYITPYVLLGYVQESGNDFPTKVQWCDTGQPEVWSGGNSGAQLLSDEPSFIRQIKRMRNYAMVYKEGSIYRGQLVNTSAIFDFSLLTTGKGLYASRTVADDGEKHYYMGNQDFHVNNGVRITDIGRPVREYLFNRLNRGRNFTCHSQHVEQYKEVWFFVTVTGQNWPTEVWKYNYELDFWYFDTISNCLTTAFYRQVSSVTWDEAIGTWNSQTGSWNGQQTSPEAPVLIYGMNDGTVQKLNQDSLNDVNTAYVAQLDTKDYTGLAVNGIERDSRWLQFDAWLKGSTVKFYYSKDYGSTWTLVSTKTLSSTIEKVTFYFDVIAKHIRFRLYQEESLGTLTIRSFTPYFLDAGEILQ